MAADSLVRQVLDAHGGRQRWQRAGALQVDVRCGGAALAARFQPRVYLRYRARVDLDAPRVRFSPFKGFHGVFTPDRVWIETERGDVVEARDAPRRRFPGLRRQIFWDRLDVLYFGGYAMWNYLCTPFLWGRKGLQMVEGAPWEEAGETWRTLNVRFPAALPTHCAEQIFYIDAHGLIRRHDYTAEVIGPYARAVHYCDRHQRFDGLVFPTRRRVYPRRWDNRALPLPTLIWIDIEHVAVAAT